MYQEKATDGRAEHQHCHLCTVATRRPWHSITGALLTLSGRCQMSSAALGRSCKSYSSGSGHNLLHERAVSGQCNLICRVVCLCGMRTRSCQQVKVTSTVGRPATMAHGRTSVLMAEATAGSCRGSSSMGEHCMWRSTLDCCMTWLSKFVTGVHVGVHVATTAQQHRRLTRDLQLGLRTHMLSAVLQARDMTRRSADVLRTGRELVSRNS